MPGNGALVFMMRSLSAEIRYYARVSILEGQGSLSYIFNIFLGRVNVLRRGCNTRLSAASCNLRCFNNQFASSRLLPMILLLPFSNYFLFRTVFDDARLYPFGKCA